MVLDDAWDAGRCCLGNADEENQKVKKKRTIISRALAAVIRSGGLLH